MVYENDLLINEFLDSSQESKIIDLKRIIPIGKIEKKNSDVKVSLSLDNKEYMDIHGDDAKGETARFIKIDKAKGECASVAVYAGEGYVASRNDYWTDCFKRYEGWAGADGIYSFNIANGKDNYNNMDDTKTLFFFGDTLISKIDKETLRREEPVYMPNNTYAILDGGDPKKPGALQFYYDTDDNGIPCAALKPSRDCYDFEGKGEDFSKAYFWQQDGFVHGDKLYCLPSIITEDKSQPEGFQFRCLGVAIAEVNIVNGMPDFKNARQYRTELSRDTESFNIHYGACVLPYLKEAGFENGDGYVYVYGYMTFHETRRRSLCVARVLPEDFTDWTKWSFFDGEDFVNDILKSKPLLDHVSCEMSVIPILRGKNKGKFLAVFQYDTNSNYTAYAYGDNIWGPFSKPRKVFYCDENEMHESVYTYNAKAHLHLSYPEKILVSYNVNCTSFDLAIQNGHIYRPRFILLEDNTISFFDRLFADAFEWRVDWFRNLNKSAVRGGTVFVGDSITQEFPLEEMLKDYMPVYNRGIGGDTTEGLLRRLEESIFELSPSKLFLLIGTNDFASFGSNAQQKIMENISLCLDKVKERLPECKIHLISILPVNNTDHPKINHDAVSVRNNQEIIRVNEKLEQLAKEKGAIYIDLYSKMLDENGNLDLSYTREGLHLSPQGYEVVARNLKQYLCR